jgi:hypothetical protein
VSKYIPVFTLIISLSERVNDRDVLKVVCILDIDMKPIRCHQVQATPVRTSDRSRELLDLRKNIIRKFHIE